MKVVLASNNQGKIREFAALLKPFQIELVTQASLGVEDIEETGITFVENALLKARHASLKTDLPALSDDSGLCVDALGGAPGIYSARYAGRQGDAQKNIVKLLADLESVPDQERSACFYSVLVFINEPKDPIPLICTGQWNGILLRTPKGDNGFGYDPIFYVASENKTSAELSPERKNELSHRGTALRKLIELLPGKL